MDRMTSFEGDTGPYLQYAHARLCSITRKAEMSQRDVEDADFSLLTERHAVDLVRSLAQWPDVVQNTVKTQEPVTILTYLFKMTHALSSSYDHLQVLGSELPLKKARLGLYMCARQVLNNGMAMLGLNPVERWGSSGLPSRVETALLMIIAECDSRRLDTMLGFLSLALKRRRHADESDMRGIGTHDLQSD